MEIFNTTPHVVTAITGVNAALEKEASQNPDFDVNSINNIKVGLMGPFAGIGDSFFWGTFRIIAAAIGISLAQQGSPFGFILFLLLFNIPHFIIKYYLTVAGYRFGTDIMKNAKESGILQTISKGATIVGLMVIGGMSASMVSLTTPLQITLGETAFTIQSYLDQIFPLLLPFGYVLAMYGLLKKGYEFCLGTSAYSCNWYCRCIDWSLLKSVWLPQCPGDIAEAYERKDIYGKLVRSVR